MADLVADAMALFSLARMGFWLYDERRSHPFSLAAQHGVGDEVIEWVSSLRSDDEAAGLVAIRTGEVVTLRDTLVHNLADPVRDIYRRNGIRSVCFAPIIFRGEPLGLLVLYHDRVHQWTAEETAIARGFADQMATAVSNARLNHSVRSLAARLEAVQELAVRLNGTRDLDEIARVLVEGTESLIVTDSIRLYRVDHDAGTCEILGFKGSFGGTTSPDPASLRVRIGEGVTGWVAANNQSVLLGDAEADPRAIKRFLNVGPESLLAVPISPLCREDCAGLCPVCGGNRNQVPCTCAARGEPAATKRSRRADSRHAPRRPHRAADSSPGGARGGVGRPARSRER